MSILKPKGEEMATKPKLTRAQYKQKGREFIEFAQEHNLVIHPDGTDRWAENWFMFHACACDINRPHCPCPESLDETKDQGYCKCRLFWRDYQAYLDWVDSPVDRKSVV